ncbi:membrane protein [Xenorhabdus mauleonii]|uniref:Membrane protein n=1 Tax=Xenorhabdus mauleonii TaxID=351675 RepID=A0A1I3IWV4_9GAMM|nr:DUF6693 family protein [Xenorhabdus mauleonii]PHM46021.1 membrane protein [Xenorhabdus mauleonii]SFI52417.1 hypothetical protein SAMN05421680_10210 [Xenorhabdus mauleonii]
MNLMDFRNLKLKPELSIIEIFLHLIVWFLITLLTLGLGAFVFPYYMTRLIINKTLVIDRNSGKIIGKLDCEINFAQIIGYVILWAILSFITFGLLYFVYLYKIIAHCINHTHMASV